MKKVGELLALILAILLVLVVLPVALFLDALAWAIFKLTGVSLTSRGPDPTSPDAKRAISNEGRAEIRERAVGEGHRWDDSSIN